MRRRLSRSTRMPLRVQKCASRARRCNWTPRRSSRVCLVYAYPYVLLALRLHCTCTAYALCRDGAEGGDGGCAQAGPRGQRSCRSNHRQGTVPVYAPLALRLAARSFSTLRRCCNCASRITYIRVHTYIHTYIHTRTHTACVTHYSCVFGILQQYSYSYYERSNKSRNRSNPNQFKPLRVSHVQLTEENFVVLEQLEKVLTADDVRSMYPAHVDKVRTHNAHRCDAIHLH